MFLLGAAASRGAVPHVLVESTQKRLKAPLNCDFFDVAKTLVRALDSPLLMDFGMKPASAKAKPRTASEKAVAAALAKQTKAVRGPTGKNERAATTAAGKPGLVLVSASGTPMAIPNGVVGPTPPGSSIPVDAAASLAPVGGSTPSGGSTPGSSTPTGK